MSECPFVVGAEVAIVTTSNWSGDVSLRYATVAKVYKTGHIVLAGDAQRWKTQNGRDGWRAYQTGARYSGTFLAMPSDDLTERANATKRRNIARAALFEIEKYSRASRERSYSEEDVKRIREFVEWLLPKEGSN